MKKIKNWFIGDYLAKTDDVFRKAKIELIYNYCLFFFILGLIFYGNLIANGLWYHFYIITFASFALLSILFTLKYTQNYKIAGNWFVVQQTITSGVSVTIQEYQADMSGGLWTISFILFIIFIFGAKGGLLRLIPFLSFFMTVVVLSTQGIVVDLGIPESQQLPNQPFVSLVPFSLCVYLAVVFVRTNLAAQGEIIIQKSLLEHKNKEVTDSINYAQRIQKAILPSHRLVESYLPKSFVVYLPKDIVSGDFYWVEKKGNKVFFAVADCTGHGVPGAMMSVIGQNAINRVINEFGITKPSEILDKLTVLVEEAFSKSGSDVRDGMDICLCSLDTTTNKLEYSGANNPVYIYSSNELKEIKATKQPIGRFESKINFVNHEVQLNNGDAVYLFTDGIADQFGGPDGKKYKYKRVKELLLQNNSKSHSEQKNNIITEFVKWKGQNEQIDDVCLMGIKI